jgi:cytidyltransferase-like protein
MALNFKEELAVPNPSSSADPTMTLSRAKVAAARADQSGRVYRVYCDGVFDLFHLAHMRMFEQAKKALGPEAKVHLIAGVCSDELGTTHLPYSLTPLLSLTLCSLLTRLPCPFPPASFSPSVQGQDRDESQAPL